MQCNKPKAAPAGSPLPSPFLSEAKDPSQIIRTELTYFDSHATALADDRRHEARYKVGNLSEIRRSRKLFTACQAVVTSRRRQLKGSTTGNREDWPKWKFVTFDMELFSLACSGRRASEKKMDVNKSIAQFRADNRRTSRNSNRTSTFLKHEDITATFSTMDHPELGVST